MPTTIPCPVAAATVLLLSVWPTAVASAQTGKGGQVELGVLGAYTTYDKASVGLTADAGAGGRLGVFFNRTFALEVRGDQTRSEDSVSGKVDVTRMSGTLYAYAPATAVGRFYLGAGYTRSLYRGAADVDSDGGHVILGDLIPLGERIGLRLEGRADFIPSSALVDPSANALNFGGAAGLSVFAFGGPPRDSDGDGIPDKHDACPDTPIGAVVDARGCPLDGDRDGVYDGLDVCPDTPAGAVVDGTGCSVDSDRDGVPDGIDVCPDTPEGAVVDAQGCPLDTDTDGVFDGLDHCPDTPPGAVVDADGCPLDGDGDGVPDGIDQCPDTPVGVSVNAAGCPIDSDGDGVPDGIDQCPNTPAGREVDVVGCPVLFAVAQAPLVLRGVNFETGRSALTPDSYAILDDVAASLLAQSEVRVEIGGHTDNTGSRATNARLSLERAQAVKAYLAQQGVAPARMEVKGYGPDSPVATNATVDGRARNRRVELRRIDREQ
jgi:OOP family OmpA-OmpF porin